MAAKKQLPRLTAESLRQIVGKLGKAAAYCELMTRGYTAEEIACWSARYETAADVCTSVRNHCRTHRVPVPASAAFRREPDLSRPAHPSDWRAAFRCSVMRTGMVLSLTQGMLDFLCATADGVTWDRSGNGASTLARPDTSITTARSLEKRGLVRWKQTEELRTKEYGTSFCELTDAGAAVVELLKVTGVFVPADRAIARGAQ